MNGLAVNACTTREWSYGACATADITATFEAMKAAAKRVNDGDLSGAEAMLTAQSIVLNALFTDLAHRARLNAGEYIKAAETYMRLALRAQSQCRATCETLAVLKNPPVFAKQANIAHGPQQVNNAPGGETPEPSRAGETGIAQNELLEAEREPRQLESGQRLDVGASSITGTRDPALVPVGAINGAAKR